ncbi:MAG: hypothetical protein KatS3mg111_3489 [Pirellulaceae bacterium]|nr:MAG: hypothetical protein KatS3mg111_3489 [Pirellulaceae bacterium]
MRVSPTSTVDNLAPAAATGPATSPSSRRTFLKTATACGVAAGMGMLRRAANARQPEVIVGQGEHVYRVHHHWPQLPDRYSWQTTHNVAVDQAGNLYVIHEGRAELPDHPSIFVFDPEGRFVRAFGHQFQGGGHGLEIREEDGEEFLYVTGYQQLKNFGKLTLKGEIVWLRFAPTKSGVYAAEEAIAPQRVWGRNRFMPTNFAFLPDGGFLLADGYGAYYIHRYDRHGNWVDCFGGPGEGKGKFNTPHGLWVDTRGDQPLVVVTDRAHHTLQRFDLEGHYLDTIEGFGLPANVATQGSLMLVPELLGRVSLLDENNQVIAHLGADVERVVADKNRTIRRDEKAWLPGKFVHPHDACFDDQGNIYVAEWVATGRVTKLERIH